MDIQLITNRIFLAGGYTDMRKSIDGLSAVLWLMEGLSIHQPKAVKMIHPRCAI